MFGYLPHLELVRLRLDGTLQRCQDLVNAIPNSWTAHCTVRYELLRRRALLRCCGVGLLRYQRYIVTRTVPGFPRTREWRSGIVKVCQHCGYWD